MNILETKIGIIGLGYVGLPLAVEFGKKFEVIGYDIDSNRIKSLVNYIDTTLETTSYEIKQASLLTFTSEPEDLTKANCYIVTVPTPVNEENQPDLKPLEDSCKLLGCYISQGDTVIFESTVFPGATEERCVPILEQVSGLKFNKDFFCGYSPERINPGDKSHRLVDIKKVTSGSNQRTAIFVDNLYSEIITAGTHRAESIKVAEAAKVIENTQRDLNIALINELSQIFNMMNIDTEAVLKAAETKWNFLSFRPGLVGGHCIGVDPYYLTYKSLEIGYIPKVILAGRKLNDSMPSYVVEKLINSMTKKSIEISRSEILVMGMTFKENCPDTRNSKVVNIIYELQERGCHVDVYDPYLKKNFVEEKYSIAFVEKLQKSKYDAVVIAVAHNEFASMSISSIRELCKVNSVVYDLKYVFDKNDSDIRL